VYRRNLPHWHPPAAAIFVTWRLAGTFPSLGKTCPDGRRFVQQDKLLDHASDGPTWLRQPEIAGCVVNCLGEGAGVSYDLHAFVVMPNHVHILIRPRLELAAITRAIKGKSARPAKLSEANAILGRTGKPFWQDESFDHWIRHPWQFDKVKSYIETNPVRAGLAPTPEQWPYSSATSVVSSSPTG
jgi:REP element-mobilizing transposase RayT